MDFRCPQLGGTSGGLRTPGPRAGHNSAHPSQDRPRSSRYPPGRDIFSPRGLRTRCAASDDLARPEIRTFRVEIRLQTPEMLRFHRNIGDPEARQTLVGAIWAFFVSSCRHVLLLSCENGDLRLQVSNLQPPTFTFQEFQKQTCPFRVRDGSAWSNSGDL